jgi:hypothetical protein
MNLVKKVIASAAIIFGTFWCLFVGTSLWGFESPAAFFMTTGVAALMAAAVVEIRHI